MSNKQIYQGQLKAYDNLFHYDTNKRVIMAMRDRDSCLKVNADRRTISLDRNCKNPSANKQFTIHRDATNNKVLKIVSDSTGLCLTAPQFVEDSQAMFNTQSKSDVDMHRVVLGACPTKDYNSITAYDIEGNSLWQFGNDKTQTGQLYNNLADTYNDLLQDSQQSVTQCNQNWQAKYTRLDNEYKYEVNHQKALYEAEITENKQLQTDLVNVQRQSYNTVVAQTETIKKTMEKIRQENITKQTGNTYQLETNQQIQSIHKILFWVYFATEFIFLALLFMVLGFQNIMLFIVILVVATVYPFLIIFVEYIFVFIFSYFKAIVLGQPFVFNKLPPTNSVFFTP